MEFKKFLLDFIRNIDIKRIKWREILAAVLIIAAIGVIIIPPVAKSIENDGKNRCDSNMYILVNKLSYHMSEEGDDGEWHNMILNGHSDKALEMLIDEAKADNSINNIKSSDYYFEKRNSYLYLKSKRYPELNDRNLLIENVSEEEKYFGTFGWNSNVDRRIADVTALGGSSFIMDAGTEGKYCISAWTWADYVAGATAEDGKVYSASIVFYDGVYYYYPDGFKVRNSLDNSSPFRYAADPDNIYQSAYCIPVDTASVISGRFSTDSHEGSLMAEGGEVYIWQTRPSKSQSKGWIKIECEIKKL